MNTSQTLLIIHAWNLDIPISVKAAPDRCYFGEGIGVTGCDKCTGVFDGPKKLHFAIAKDGTKYV